MIQAPGVFDPDFASDSVSVFFLVSKTRNFTQNCINFKGFYQPERWTEEAKEEQKACDEVMIIKKTAGFIEQSQWRMFQCSDFIWPPHAKAREYYCFTTVMSVMIKPWNGDILLLYLLLVKTNIPWTHTIRRLNNHSKHFKSKESKKIKN